MTVVTRFAPSPTGYLHIGGARTALFNWLHAKHSKGKFLLRIEDTDRERSTEAAVHALLDGLSWLGIQWDGEPVFQFARKDRHAEVAQEMLKRGKAYYCYASQAELEDMRKKQEAAGQPQRYDGRWRDRNPAEAPPGVKPVIRLKAPTEGETVVHDGVRGEVRVQNSQLDDMVLLRSDGTPTYMLAVVVDDHDMGITQVIRGEEHLVNTFRQLQIYEGMGWTPPAFAHLPLIHDIHGQKLSKRKGAVGAQEYKDMGYLPEALRNYLMRLGWSHGDDEIMSLDQAVEWFSLEGLGSSPSRFDFVKLNSVNAHYIKLADDQRLVDLIVPQLEKMLGVPLTVDQRKLLLAAVPGLKPRVKTLVEMAEQAAFYFRKRPLVLDDKAKGLLDDDAKTLLKQLAARLEKLEPWTHDAIEAQCRQLAESSGKKLGQVAQPLRAALSGSTVSPPIFEVAQLLGRTETLGRMGDILWAPITA